ncbi:MAG: hypothetical protein WC872_02575 [Candidatus Absconditabacterales bacterium]
MKAINKIREHLNRHGTRVISHMKKHHKKYIFGAVGGALAVKLIMLAFTSLGIYQYANNHLTFADVQSGCSITGQYYTGGEQICYMTGQYTGSIYSGEELIGEELTGGTQICYMTGQYLTGGEQICPIVECDNGDITLSIISGSILKDIFTIGLTHGNTDCDNELISIQLLDHNNQWISIANFTGSSDSINFDSRLLSGIYNTSGLLFSGYYNITGTNASGQIYYIFTGTYTGAYTNYFTGYKLRISNQSGNIIYSGDNNIFTIDNQKPNLIGISLLTVNSNSGYIGLSGVVNLIFSSNEELTGLIINIGGATATLFSKSGLVYTYTQTLTSQNTEGNLIYNITYSDLAGNTGYLVSTGNIIFDKTSPTFTGLFLTGTNTGLTLSFVTNENTIYSLNYQTTSGQAKSYTSVQYLTSQNYIITGLNTGLVYRLNLKIFDIANNSIQISGQFNLNISGIITFNYVIVTGSLSTGTLSTGTVNTGNLLTGNLSQLTNILKQEVNKFNQCKTGIEYDSINLNILNKTFVLKMPQFQKSYVKKLVNAFSLLIITKLDENKNLKQADLDEITQKFNNFLVILKLVRDDDNTCKQSLSSYYINQFKDVMQEYKIYF